MNNVRKKLFSFALGLIFIICPTRAIWGEGGMGVRTDFGDVMIENIGLGRSYNMREIAGKPLKVTNQGKETLNLVMDVVVPKDKDILPARREAGFKPIPSGTWVTLSQSQFIVPPGESAFTDVVLTIPNDPSLYGKKFQVSIYSRSVGKGFLHVGVWSHLFLQFIQSPEAQAEMEKNRQRGFIGSMDYSLLPDKLVLTNVPIGRKIDIAQETKRTIKMANSGSDPIELRVKIIPVGDSPIGLQEGFEEAPDRSWLKISSDVFKVEGSSFVDPGLTLEIPDKPAFHKKKYMFILKVDPANPDILGVTYYGKVYIETQ